MNNSNKQRYEIPTEQEQIQYFKDQILKIMAQVESITGELFHETYPVFEADFWSKADSNNFKGLRSKHYEACRLIDELRSK
jgi:hypothetical protein